MKSFSKYSCFLFFILSFSLFTSCSDRSEYGQALSEKVQILLADEISNYEYVIVIPGSGCTGCITHAESFFVNHVIDKRYLFILTGIVSAKNLEQRFGRSGILRRDNVIVDYEGLYYLPVYEEVIYPMRFVVGKEGISKFERL